MKSLFYLPRTKKLIQETFATDPTRTAHAAIIVQRGSIRLLPNGNYQVASESDWRHTYQVSLERMECNCIDFAKRNKGHSHSREDKPLNLCKHCIAILIWTHLPEMSAAEHQAIVNQTYQDRLQDLDYRPVTAGAM
jgi:hypothetical protein